MATEDSEQKEVKESAPAAAPSKKKGKLLWIAAAALLVAAAFGGGIFLAPRFLPKPATTADSHDAGLATVEELKNEAAGGEPAKHGKPADSKKEAEKPKEGGHGAKEAEKPKEGGHGAKEGEAGGEGEAAGDDGPPVLHLSKPVVTNLAGTRRVVYAQIWIEAPDAEALDFLTKNEHYLMDTLIALFNGKSVEDVTSQEGMEQLKREIRSRVDAAVSAGKVKAVGFDRLQVQ